MLLRTKKRFLYLLMAVWLMAGQMSVEVRAAESANATQNSIAIVTEISDAEQVQEHAEMEQRDRMVSGQMVSVVQAEATSTRIYVAGEEVIVDKYYKTTDEGKITDAGASADDYNVYCTLEGTQYILTLNNATINGQIESMSKDLLIVLEGKNTVTCTNSFYPAAINVNNADLTIDGSGELTATSAVIEDASSTYSSAIMVRGDLTIAGGTITAIGSKAFAASCGIDVEGGNIYITGGTVYANCALENGNVVSKAGEAESGFCVGIYISATYEGTNSDIIINGGTVYSYGGTASGAASGIGSLGNVTINGGNVTAVGGMSQSNSDYGIGASGILTINGGVVNATGSTSVNAKSHGLGAIEGVSINGGIVNATGGTATNDNSYGIGSVGTVSISGGTVNAVGGTAATNGSFGIGSESDIIISGGNVTSTAGTSAYGIGIGTKGNLLIKDKSKVTAVSVTQGQALGAEGSCIIEKHLLKAGSSAEDAVALDTPLTEFSRYKYVKALPYYAVTVNNGIGTGEYAEETLVTITANAPEAGKQFKEWIVESGTVSLANAASSETTFTMAGEPVVVTATYEDESKVVTPQITTHPSDVTVNAGETANFAVVATGDGLTYQWKVDRHDGNGWTDISGAVQASYIKQAVDKDCDGFQYKCVVSNSAGSVESNVATLHVNEKSSDGGSDNSGDKKADKDSNSSGDNSGNNGVNNSVNNSDSNSDSNTGNNSNVSSNNNIMKRTGEKDDVPKTGDDTSIGWLFVVMIASGTGVIFSRKKREMSRG